MVAVTWRRAASLVSRASLIASTSSLERRVRSASAASAAAA
jgi:hypothetical protein